MSTKITISRRLQFILLMVVPLMQTAAALLRAADPDREGTDDIAADVLEFAAGVVQALVTGSPLPDLPDSLRPKIAETATESAAAPLPDEA